MLVLAIETATTQVGCALGAPGGPECSFQSSRGRRHAESLAPAIRFCLDQTGTEPEELSALAVDIGPGLFTGLRVGVATAKAMATALGVPVMGIPSLDVLAWQARLTARTIVPVIDAKRGEVFWSRYERDRGGVRRVSTYRAASPQELAAELEAAGRGHLLLGDGAARYAQLLGPAGPEFPREGEGAGRVEIADPFSSTPLALSLLHLAHAGAAPRVPPRQIAPMYLRKADAAINWEERRPARAEAHEAVP